MSDCETITHNAQPAPSKKSTPKRKFKIVIAPPVPETEEFPNTDQYTDPITITYINQLTPMERLTLEIAQKQLESSFNIENSIGFLEWKQKQKQ